MNKAKEIRSLFDSLGWDTETRVIKMELKNRNIDVTSQQVSNERAKSQIVVITFSKGKPVSVKGNVSKELKMILPNQICLLHGKCFSFIETVAGIARLRLLLPNEDLIIEWKEEEVFPVYMAICDCGFRWQHAAGEPHCPKCLQHDTITIEPITLF
jgi:hypothetical protein